MKREEYLKLKSVETFKFNVKRTNKQFAAYYSSLSYLSAVCDELKFTNDPVLNKKYKLKTAFKEQENLLEHLFIAQIANLEFFMYEIIYELISKNSKSISSEKIIKISDIIDCKSIAEVKKYIFDIIALEKSINIHTWAHYLKENHKINVFNDAADFRKSPCYKLLSFCSYIRNILLHSGGMVNTKFKSDLEKLGGKELSDLFKFKKKVRIYDSMIINLNAGLDGLFDDKSVFTSANTK